MKAQDAFVHDEGVQYKSQGFHGVPSKESANELATPKRKTYTRSGSSKRKRSK